MRWLRTPLWQLHVFLWCSQLYYVLSDFVALVTPPAFQGSICTVSLSGMQRGVEPVSSCLLAPPAPAALQ